MTQDKIDYSKLAEQIDPEQIVAELDTGKVAEDRFILTKRQLVALAGSGLGAGALSALGIGSADAQTASGQVGTSNNRVDLFAQDLDLAGSAGDLTADILNTTPSNPGTTKTITKTEFPSVLNTFHGTLSQRTENVSTSPQDIFSSPNSDLGRGHEMSVFGQEVGGSATFLDKVLFHRANTSVTVSSRSGSVSATRSYSSTSSTLELQMSSGSFNIIAVGLTFRHN
jgi:hypothetical protein